MVLSALDGVSGYAFYPDPKPILEYLEVNRQTVIERLGEVRGKQVWGAQVNITIFPNLQLLPGLNWFRVYHPKGAGQIEQWTWAMVENDMPEAVKAQILENQCLTFGLAGLFDNDDGDNMALGRSGKREGFPGDIAAGLVSEHNQRYFYRRWQEHMMAQNWDEVPIYNINSLADQEAEHA